MLSRQGWFWILVVTVLCVGAQVVRADSAADQNWPQWRGPDGNGVSSTANPPVQWSEETNVKWKVKIPGRGLATPIVWGDKVFVQTAVPTGKKVEPADKPDDKAADASGSDRKAAEKTSDANHQKNRPAIVRAAWGAVGGGRGGMQVEKPDEVYQFVLMCLDRATGNALWQKVVREELPQEGYRANEGSYASSSPVTDGKHVFSYFGSRGLHCFDMDGNLKWEKDLGKMNIKMSFGEGSSPAIYGNTLVVTWDHEGDDFIVAFNAETGEELWRTPRKSESIWATPLVVNVEGQPQVVTSGVNKICGYDLANGKELWQCTGLTPNAIPSPVAGDGLVYLTTGFRGSSLLAIRLGHTGDLTGTDAVAWTYTKDTPYVPSPLVYEGRLYFFKSNNAILSCLDAKSGSVLFGPERLAGLENVYASPVGAAGRVYLVGRNGTVQVIKSADKLEVFATNKLDEGIDASPVPVGNQLFLRGKEHLYCIEGI